MGDEGEKPADTGGMTMAGAGVSRVLLAGWDQLMWTDSSSRILGGSRRGRLPWRQPLFHLPIWTSSPPLLSPSIKSNPMFCSMFSWRRTDSVFFVTWLALHTPFKMLSFEAKRHENELLKWHIGQMLKGPNRTNLCWFEGWWAGFDSILLTRQQQSAKWVIPHIFCCQSKWNLECTPDEWQRASYRQIFEDRDCSRWDQRWRKQPLLKWKRH